MTDCHSARNCANCGDTFSPERGNAKYRRRVCKEKAKKKRKYRPKLSPSIDCAGCGLSFAPAVHNAKFCSERCRSKGERLQRKKHYSENKQRALSATRKWQSANREKVRDSSRRWYITNREKRLADMAVYRREVTKPKIDTMESEIVAKFAAEPCLGRKVALAKLVLDKAREDWITANACQRNAVDQLLGTYACI